MQKSSNTECQTEVNGNRWRRTKWKVIQIERWQIWSIETTEHEYEYERSHATPLVIITSTLNWAQEERSPIKQREEQGWLTILPYSRIWGSGTASKIAGGGGGGGIKILVLSGVDLECTAKQYIQGSFQDHPPWVPPRRPQFWTQFNPTLPWGVGTYYLGKRKRQEVAAFNGNCACPVMSECRLTANNIQTSMGVWILKNPSHQSTTCHAYVQLFPRLVRE